LVQDAVDAMGGADALRGVQSYVMRGGSGTRSRLGQPVSATQVDPPAMLSNVVETLDLAGGRAALEYELVAANGFAQHRQEILTSRGDEWVGLENVTGRPLAVVSPSGLFSWGTQNHPSMALRRSVVTIALAALDADAPEPPQERELNGRMVPYGSVQVRGEAVGLYFDPDSKRIAAMEMTDTETMIGDVQARYMLDDYRDVGGVMLPHAITVHKGGGHYADVQFVAAAINDPEGVRVFDIPAAAEAAVDHAIAQGADYSPVTLIKVADGLHFAQAYSHHSLVVEFPTFLTVVEAPYTEAQSLTLGRLLAAQFPGKPLRYAVVTHPHYDHIGGMRGIAAQGATIVAARGHEAALRAVLDAPHTNPPDVLAGRRSTGAATGGLEFFDDTRVITDGGRSLELYAVTGSPHVDPMVLAYVPGPRVLFQSDLFFPGTGGGTSPAAEHLLQSVRALNLRVQTNAGGHGGVAPFAELVKAVGTAGGN
jgi:glyoxylase-like metal-dependent hydrolase (beta-lactamase superfamily II)